ncbi:peptide-methionine (R)-S-oxide reductase [bacterium]|nr:peptide-methionine (R)-S-oxide reductase [bacterium]
MSEKYSVEKSPEEWREQLTPDEYQVLRNHGTERPFTGEYWDFKGEGEYHCRACGILLFESGTKFDSGCGWPSFFAAHKQAVEYKEDFSHGMHRVEVLCKSCGSHLGHVFQDAPQTPSGQRYCINSVCLNFTPKSKQ